MPNKSIHIISFDNPYPPVYGGIIEVFYKVKALHAIGYKIHLHCFVSSNEKPSPELEAITEKVFFYKSPANPLDFFSDIPFSVLSRKNPELLNNLLEIKMPILFEGLKTVFLAKHPQLKEYYKILRLHNIEQDYFLGISKSEKSLVKKILFYFESLKYTWFEEVTRSFDQVLTLSQYENEYVIRKFGNASYIPVFHGNEKVAALDGMGDFAFYHGDLETADNRAAAEFLIETFKEIPDYSLVIASSAAPKTVEKVIGTNSNIKYVQLQDFQHLQQLMHEAHICISWSFQKSGTKLKVVNALFNSRFSIINENIVDDPVVAELCEVVSDQQQLISKINQLKMTSFTDFNKRKSVLEVYLADKTNAEKIDQLMPGQ